MKELKYSKEKYNIRESNFVELAEEGIRNHREKLVKCGISHSCWNCKKLLSRGEYAIRETGFLDDEPISSYLCTDCMEHWLDELNGM